MKRFCLLCAVVFAMLMSCNNNNQANRESQLSWLQLPDEELTLDQLKLKKQLIEVISDNMIIEDNTIKLTISRKEFEKLGIPEIYYDFLKEDIKNDNKYIKENGIEYSAEDWEKDKAMAIMYNDSLTRLIESRDK